MFTKFFRILITLAGMVLGYGLADLLFYSSIISIQTKYILWLVYGVFIIIFGIIFYLLSPKITREVESLIDHLELKILNQPKEKLLIGLFGIIIGLILAFLFSLPLSLFDFAPILEGILKALSALIYYAFAVLGCRFAIRHQYEVLSILRKKNKDKIDKDIKQKVKKENIANNKLIDTSVLIDGRIKPVVETGFIDGTLIITKFVLEELQKIADSSDDLKRERGRRGLDIVNELKKTNKCKVVIEDRDFPNINEVDIKLLKLAGEINSSILTNDYNLNKLAQVQNIKVLNINDLANSIKTVVIPGEKMKVTIVREGKEKKQGLAYLEDGTMIVVEDAKDLIGKEVYVEVTTVLQTSAGKMIFTKMV